MPGMAHHVTQRGNYRQWIFENREDFKKYCEWLNEYAKKFRVDIVAYCLMSNHVHLVVVPNEADGISRLLNLLNMRYAQFKNKKKKAKGHLWQGRYFSCLIDGSHLHEVIRYVELNPVRAKIVDKAWKYIWSSARTHLGLERKPIVEMSDKYVGKDVFKDHKNWCQYLGEDEDEDLLEGLRLRTKRCLVMGTKEFVEKLENRIGRSLACLMQGRPKKGS